MCALDQHKGHDCAAGAKAAESLRAEADRLLRELAPALAKLEELSQRLSQRADSLAGECLAARGELTTLFRLLVTELDAMRDRALAALEACEASVALRATACKSPLAECRALVSEGKSAASRPLGEQLRFESALRRAVALVGRVDESVPEKKAPAVRLDVVAALQQVATCVKLSVPQQYQGAGACFAVASPAPANASRLAGIAIADSSLILTNAELCADLGRVMGQQVSVRLELLYRGSREGLQSTAFHAKCDGRAPTLSVVRSKKGNIFGGYASVPWKSAGDKSPDAAAFIFSLKGPHAKPGAPLKFVPKDPTVAVFHNASHLSSFVGSKQRSEGIYLHGGSAGNTDIMDFAVVRAAVCVASITARCRSQASLPPR
jgi:hypothetical protein